jgi:nitroreductase
MDAIFKRRSIRQYTDEPVSAAQVEALLRAAMAAPSAGNQQPWHFVVIDDPAVKDRIPEVHPYAKMVRQAPVTIAVCADMTTIKHEEMWIQDCAAATQNLLLAATDLGLGTVWLGVYPRADRMAGVATLLNLPEHIVPFSLVPVGHGAEEKAPTDRYPAERIHRNAW